MSENGSEIFLSFIIPLYNCQDYIAGCLRSIRDSIKGKDDIEIIVVDDGSIDDGSYICNGFCREIPDLHLVTQYNKGASAARNAGISFSKGKYIWFVDADDRICTDSFDAIYQYLKAYMPDVIVFNYNEETADGEHENRAIIQTGLTDVGEYLCRNRGLFLWNKIFSRSIIGETRFLDGTKNIEDFLFNIEVLVKIDLIHAINCQGYIYNTKNVSSTSRNKSLRNLVKLSSDSIRIHTYIQQMLPGLPEGKKKVVTDLLSFSIGGYLYSLLKYYNLKQFYKIIHLYNVMGLFPVKRTVHPRMNRFLRITEFLWIMRWLYNLHSRLRHLITL